MCNELTKIDTKLYSCFKSDVFTAKAEEQLSEYVIHCAIYSKKLYGAQHTAMNLVDGPYAT